MGLLDLFKKNNVKRAAPKKTLAKKNSKSQLPEKKSTVADSEKKYYQPDSYYTDKAHEGTMFERNVITFERRKSTCFPSRNGLYVAEILLLEYCSYGTYPGPKNGYPGFWWFKYGVRDVGKMLCSLEERGYIRFAPATNSVSKLSIAQLKEMLIQHDLSISGKKAVLVERIISNISENDLLKHGIEQKYELTNEGKQELEENAYVPYMHKHPNTTTDDDSFGPVLNIWSINRMLGNGDKSNWRDVVEREEKKRDNYIAQKNKSFMSDLKKLDPEGYEKLKEQDDQIAMIQKAEGKYESNSNIDELITFWENIWANGGLKFEGSRWHFRLPDLYIKMKRFDDALAIVQKIKKSKNNYSDKADSYITKIEERKAKTTTKKQS